MAINSIKTKYMLITTRQKRQLLNIKSTSLFIRNEKICEVQNHKLLGITIDNNLTWSCHISKLTNRVSQKVYQLNKIKHFLDRHSREIFFHAHIQSVIDYCSTIWDKASQNILKPLCSIHRRALKLILLKSSTLHTSDY